MKGAGGLLSVRILSPVESNEMMRNFIRPVGAGDTPVYVRMYVAVNPHSIVCVTPMKYTRTFVDYESGSVVELGPGQWAVMKMAGREEFVEIREVYRAFPGIRISVPKPKPLPSPESSSCGDGTRSETWFGFDPSTIASTAARIVRSHVDPEVSGVWTSDNVPYMSEERRT